MRQEDYRVKDVTFANLREGDLLKSKNGRTFRRVIMLTADEAIVRVPGGSVSNIPATSIEPFWDLVEVLSSDIEVDV